jgi:hypothetical protein
MDPLNEVERGALVVIPLLGHHLIKKNIGINSTVLYQYNLILKGIL